MLNPVDAPASEDVRLLTKVATLYYRHDFTQDQIARQLGLSRQMTGRLLQRARQQGVVTIEIRSPLSFVSELECALENAFGLTDAVVVTPFADTEESSKEALGRAAAALLMRRVRRGDVIGLSWSSTIYECVHHLSPHPVGDVRVVQLNGGLTHTLHPTRAEEIVHRAAEMLGGQPTVLTTPLVCDRLEIKASLMSDSRIAAAVELARRASIAMVGIGSLSGQSSLYKTGYLDAPTLQRLQTVGAVGDICGRFYNLHGAPCAPDLSECTIGIELAELGAKTLSVGVAGGDNKIEAILGALRGRYCNVLVTDERTAAALTRES